MCGRESVAQRRYFNFPSNLRDRLTLVTVMLPKWLRGKESACNAGRSGLIPGLGRSPGEGNGNPLQYSCLENSMDRGAWQATIHGVTKSRTWLSEFYFTSVWRIQLKIWPFAFWISLFRKKYPLLQSSVLNFWLVYSEPSWTYTHCEV